MFNQDEIWGQFRDLAAESQYADKLRLLIATMDGMYQDPQARFAVMAAILGLVAPLEWPPRLDEARQQLVSALRTLLHELGAHRDGTLASRLHRALGPAFHDSLSMVEIGHEMLMQPCLPAQLSHVSQLCNIGLRSCLGMLRDALEASEPSEEIRDARVAFLYAYTRYADASREMNRQCGAALFQAFSSPLSR